MNKIFITTLLAITVTLGSIAAEGNKAGFALPKSLPCKFNFFSNVKLTAGTGYTKATFIDNNKRTEAFYSSEGELIGTKQVITPEELPVNAKRAFAKEYPGFTVKEAIRFEGVEENAYYISAENEKGSVALKVEDDGTISAVTE